MKFKNWLAGMAGAALLAWTTCATAFAADAPAAQAASETAAGKDLFNGKDLKGWLVTDFGGQGETEVKDGKILTHQGASCSGVQYTNALPTNNFRITLEAMKVMGDDFFCGLTFPVGKSHCSLIVGGWGGGVVGLSSLDGMDASENDLTKYMNFKKEKWYKIRADVTTERIKVWIDQDLMIDADIKERKVDVRPGPIEMQKPFGICAYQTTAAWRNIRIEPLAVAKP
jgi:hypothetical protein